MPSDIRKLSLTGNMLLEIFFQLAGLVLASIGLVYVRRDYQRKYREVLDVTVTPLKQPYLIEWAGFPGKHSNKNLYLVKRRECLIINSGEITVSVARCEVPQVHGDINSISFNHIAYSADWRPNEGEVIKTKSGFAYSMPVESDYFSNKEIRFPISIAPGESERFVIKIGVFIGPLAQTALQEALNKKIVGSDTHEALAFLKEQGLGLLPGNNLDQMKQVCFITSRGSCFDDVISLNGTFVRTRRTKNILELEQV